MELTAEKVIKDTVTSRQHLYLYGGANTGKTRTAYTLARYMGGIKELPYFKSTDRYWNSYNKEKVILIDNLTKETAKYIQNYINTWSSYYRFRAKTISRKERNEDEKESITDDNIIDPQEYIIVICSRDPPDSVFSWKRYETQEDKFRSRFNIIKLDEHYLNSFSSLETEMELAESKEKENSN